MKIRTLSGALCTFLNCQWKVWIKPRLQFSLSFCIFCFREIISPEFNHIIIIYVDLIQYMYTSETFVKSNQLYMYTCFKFKIEIRDSKKLLKIACFNPIDAYILNGPMLETINLKNHIIHSEKINQDCYLKIIQKVHVGAFLNHIQTTLSNHDTVKNMLICSVLIIIIAWWWWWGWWWWWWWW